MILAVLFLAVSMVFGYAVVKKIGFARSREEEVFFAIALGLPLTAHVTYASFFVFGSFAPVAATVLEALASFLLLRKSKGGKFELNRGFWLRFTPIALAVMLIYAGALHVNQSGDYGSSWIFYSDSYYHINIAKYFAFNDIVPPQDVQYSGQPLNYPFLMDLYSGSLERLGFTFPLAFALPAALMIIAFFAAVYFLALRISGSRNAAFFAAAMLFFSGTLSYGLMYEDIQKHNSVAEWLDFTDRDYGALIETPYTGTIIQFFKSSLVPQRSSNFGYTFAVVVFILLFDVVSKMEKSARSNRNNRDLKLKMAVAGAFTGLLPLMRETAFLSAIAVAGGLALLYRRKEWIWFFVPAVLLAAPQLYNWVGPASGSGYIALDWEGWRAHTLNPAQNAWFWIQNLGIPAVLAIIGFFLSPRPVKKYYLAFMPLFIAINIARFSPDSINSMKILHVWMIPTFILAGFALAKLSGLAKRRNIYIPAALALLILAMSLLPGVLSIYRDSSRTAVLYSKADVEFAKDAGEILPKNAVVLAFDGPHVFDLVGRVRMLGFPAVGWVKGHADWYQRVLDERDFYAGKRMVEVAVTYNLTHVSLTHYDRRYESLNDSAIRNSPFLNRVYKRNLNGNEYEIYEVRKETLD